jgi:hypothetical protein
LLMSRSIKLQGVDVEQNSMTDTNWLEQAEGGLALGLLISSFLLLFITIGLNQRKKRQSKK